MTPSEAETFQERMRERVEQQRLDADVNSYLRHELLAANDRDVEEVNNRIDQIKQALADRVEEFEDLRFGGSIAKHTYVEGLSDVDVLVALKDERLADRPPDEVRREFARTLEGKLSAEEVADIHVGPRAVTVVYRDGTEIQLLPAVQRGDTMSISSADGTTWQHEIKPKAFADQLTATNRAQGGTVVPAIKLAKEIIASQLPSQRQPSGYHVEALAVDAFADYDVPKTPKAMLQHFFRTASERVRRPLADITGQSRSVDESLGTTGSSARVTLARDLANIANRMEQSQSVDDWKRLFGL
ncbi:MAG TPA: CBASS oligonucleotide cyclase [Gaiellaceae bacterium]